MTDEKNILVASISNAEIAVIFQEALGVTVTPEDDFFDAGGDSLLAELVVSRIRDLSGVDLPSTALFDYPSARKLAEFFEVTRNGSSIPAEPIRRWGKQEYRASYAQTRLWLVSRMRPESTAYNLCDAYRLKGELKVSTVEEALKGLVERHESLRTTFAERGGELVQRVQTGAEATLGYEDLRGYGLEERRKVAEEKMRGEARQVMGLEAGPLFRCRLLRVEEEEHILVVTMHHVISDRWSRQVMMAELAQLYEAREQGRAAGLAEMPVQYGDYAEWQRERLEGEGLEKQARYWREQLAGAPEVLELPLDRVRRGEEESPAGMYGFRVEKRLSLELQKLSQGEGVTLFMMLLAVFQVLMGRYSGQEDVCIGSPIANRTRREVEGLIGFFVNTLVLRGQMGGNPSFREYLRRTREVAVGAYNHQEMPFEQLVSLLRPERGVGGRPLVQVMFALQNVPVERWEGGGLKLNPVRVGNGTAKFDLSVMLEEGEEEISGQVEFDAGVLEEGTVARMMSSYVRLLEEAVANPGQGIYEMKMLGEEERRMLLEEWGRGRAGYSLEGSVVKLLEERAAKQGEAVAVRGVDGRLSYGELNARANQVAHWLRGRGIGRGKTVGIVLERSAAMIVCMVGVVKAGAAYVPVDVGYPEERILYALGESGTEVALSGKEGVRMFAGSGIEGVEVEGWKFVEGQAESNPGVELEGSDCAYEIYTSGSTGQPKGVRISHRSLLNLVRWHQQSYEIGEQDRASQIASPGFDASVWEIWPNLASGSEIAMVEEEVKLSPERLREWVEREGITVVFLPTPLAELLLGECGWRPSRLRAMLVGGDRLTRRPAEEQGFAVINHYGPTEGTVVTTAGEVSRRDESGRAPDIGRPIGNAEVYILDKYGEPVPVGVRGELYIGGEGVALGYVREPDPEKPRFVKNRFGAGLMYRSGDEVRYLGDGRIEFLGRGDEQIKVRGYRIELGEIKAVLEEQAGVREAVVTVEESENQEAVLVGYVVKRSDEELDGERLRAGLKKKLPQYMVPSTFVVLPRLPLTQHGKLDRSKLAGMEKITLSRRYEEPQSWTERMLAAIWARLLRTSSVGLHDNFFELGGNSLLAAQMVNRIESELNVTVPMAEIFKHSTCQELACRLDSLLFDSPETEPIRRWGKQEYRASYAQTRLWLVSRMRPESTAYNLCDAYRLKGELKVSTVEEALKGLVERHESLRTTFAERGGELVQRVQTGAEATLGYEDLRGYGLEERRKVAEEKMRGEARQVMGLEAGPLFRCRLLRVEEEEHILVVTMHHVISDRWSRQVMMAELAQLYEAREQGRAAGLAEMPVQYGDYAEWQRERLEGEGLEKQARYWREQLAGAPEVLELPLDRVRRGEEESPAGMYGFRVEKRLSLELQKLSQGEGVTLFMMLLAVFQVLMGRYSGQEDVCIGSPIANRTRREVEGLIGFFVNTLVLRGQMGGNPSFREYLRRTREVAVGAYNHQEMPFEQLVSLLRPERGVGGRPLVQVMFALQNVPVERWEGGGLKLNPVRVGNGTAKFDLSVMLEEGEEEISGQVEFDAGVLEEGTVARMMSSYVRLLEEAVANPGQGIYEMKMLGEEERRMLLEEWGRGRAGYSLEGSVVKLLEERAAKQGEAVAVRGVDGRLSYGELNARANQVAHWLRGRGIGRGKTVGIVLERSAAMIVCMVGVVKAGAAYVPVDVGYPEERILYALGESGTEVALSGKEGVRMFAGSGIEGVEVEGWKFVEGQAESNPGVELEGSDCAYEIYTSGSTGQPKGVRISHRSLLNLVRWHQQSYEIGEQDRASQIASPGFDASVWEIWPNLASGSEIAMVEEEVKLSPERLREWVEREGITVVFLPTPLAELLLGECGWRPSRLRAMLVGGDRLTRRPAEEQGFAVINHYGPTEGTVVTTAGEVSRRDESGRAPDIGRPIGNAEVYILDKYGEPVPVGVRGELYIGGEGVALGYVREPDPEKPRFVKNRFGAGLMYRSGDEVRYLGDGRIEFLGRGDEQIKVRGYRIELGEIKAVLEEQAGVREAVVTVEESENQEAVLVGYVVKRSDEELDGERLRAGLKKKLPQYMVPSTFVVLPRLPLTQHGKLDRSKLAGMEKITLSRRYEEPQSWTERMLAAIWARLLRTSSVGLHDNFFELGGNSLLAMQSVSEGGRQGLQFTIRDVFHHQTIAGISMVAKTQRSYLPESCGNEANEIPITPIQRWFFELGLKKANHWNTSMLLCAADTIDTALLEVAIRRVLERHNSLRLQFKRDNDEWVQYFHQEKCDLPLTCFDLSACSEDVQLKELRRITSEIHASFSFGQGWLVRFAFFRLAPRGNRLFMAAHHLVCDGVSLHIISTELASIYSELTLSDHHQELPGAPSFARWARYTHDAAALEQAMAERECWLPVKRSAIPVDFPDGVNTTQPSGLLQVTIGKPESSALISLARERYKSSIDAVLLWAIASTFMDWTDQRYLTINIVGREVSYSGVDLNRTVGWLNVHFPFFWETPEDLAPWAALKDVVQKLETASQRGLSYGILRFIYNRKFPERRFPLREEPEVGFNYLGNFDAMFGQNPAFTIAHEETGVSADPANLRPFKLRVFCSVRGGQLRADWLYSPNLYRAETIQSLAVGFEGKLKKLLAT